MSLTLAPWNVFGGLMQGVTTITSSPSCLRPLIRFANLIFMPAGHSMHLHSSKSAYSFCVLVTRLWRRAEHTYNLSRGYQNERAKELKPRLCMQCLGTSDGQP